MEVCHFRPYLCKLCGRRVHSITALQQHTRIHRTIFPYQCSLCSKSFRVLSQLKAHQPSHDREKPLMCGWCDDYFLEQYQLGQHLLRQHKILASCIGTRVIFASSDSAEDSVPEAAQGVFPPETDKVRATSVPGLVAYNKTADNKYTGHSHEMPMNAVVPVPESCLVTPGLSGKDNTSFQIGNHFIDEKMVDCNSSVVSAVERDNELDNTEMPLVNVNCISGSILQNGACNAFPSEESVSLAEGNNPLCLDDVYSSGNKDAVCLMDTVKDLNDNAMAARSFPDLGSEECVHPSTKDDNQGCGILSGNADIELVDTPVLSMGSEDGDTIQTDDAEMNEAIMLLTELEDAALDSSDEKDMNTSETFEDSQAAFQLAMMTDDDSQNSTVPTVAESVLRGDPSLHVCPSRENLLLFDEGVSFLEEGETDKSKSSELSSMMQAWHNSSANLSTLMMACTPHKLSVDPGAASLNASPAMSPFRATVGNGDSDSDDSDMVISKGDPLNGPVSVDKESSISPGHTEANNELPIQPNAINFTRSVETLPDFKSLTKGNYLPKSSLDNLKTLTQSVSASKNASIRKKDETPHEWKLVNGEFCKVSLDGSQSLDTTALDSKDYLIKDEEPRSFVCENSDPVPQRKKRKRVANTEEDFVYDEELPEPKVKLPKSKSHGQKSDPNNEIVYHEIPKRKRGRPKSKSSKQLFNSDNVVQESAHDYEIFPKGKLDRRITESDTQFSEISNSIDSDSNKFSKRDTNLDSSIKADNESSPTKQWADVFAEFVNTSMSPTKQKKNRRKSKSSKNSSDLDEDYKYTDPSVTEESIDSMDEEYVEFPSRKSRPVRARTIKRIAKKDIDKDFVGYFKKEARPQKRATRRASSKRSRDCYSDASSPESEQSEVESQTEQVPAREKLDNSKTTEYNLRPNRRKNFQFLHGESNAECECCTYADAPSNRTVNVKHYREQASKVHDLRVLITRLIKTVFPDIQYPNLFREDSLAVEFLMDEIMTACTGRCHKKKVLTPFGKITDKVQIVVCKYPLGCLRHLRRKAVRLLSTLLPGIQCEGLDASRVDALIEEVIQTNMNASTVDQLS